MKLDSLLNVWNSTTNHDTTRLKAIETIYRKLYWDSNPDSIIFYSKQQLSFSRDKKMSQYESNALYAMGRAYYIMADYINAIEYCKQSYNLKQKLNDQIGIGRIFNIMGNVYNAQGNNALAIDYYTKSIKIREQIKDIDGSAGSLNNIGNIYAHQGEYLKAIDYYKKSFDRYEEIKSPLAATALSSLGDAYSKIDSNTIAMGYLMRSLELLEKTNRYRDIVPTMVSIGNLYSKSKEYDKALDYYNRAIALSEQKSDPLILSISLFAISDFYFKQGDYQKSIQYNKRALENSIKAEYTVQSKDISESLYKSYKKTGDYKKALDMYELYIHSRDSILSENNQREVMSQEFKYNYEKKSLTDSINFANKKKIDDLKHEAELKVEQNQRYALYGGLSLVIIFSLFIFNRFKVTQKQKKIIEHQKHQIVESINYSKKIQASLLPSVNEMQKTIDNLFVMYEPKDIVSGDFYWYKQFEKYTVLACVDCTGHGVPGGFMSTLGSLLLDKVVNDEILSPAEILSNLSNEIIRVLHQQDGGEIQDGMDLSVCLIDKQSKKIQFSGARNGIVVVSDGVPKRYKADLFPVGGNYMKKDKPMVRNFKTQEISITPNDWIYMYTDGFMEQIGGGENLPMNYNQFETILKEISNGSPSVEKLAKLKQELDNWRGRNDRDDDVLIVGFQMLKPID